MGFVNFFAHLFCLCYDYLTGGDIMKEFKKSNVVTYNLMSFTGFKSLMLFTLLLESPKSYAEVCEFFRSHEYIKEEISIDTFRVYITSLKRSGCEIVRSSSKDGSKYKIVSHPFELKISEEQVKSIIKVYRIILKTIDLSGLFDFEKFLRKLIEKTNNEQLLEALNKVSVFKGMDFGMLDELFRHTKEKRQIKFLYNSPRGPKIEVELALDKIGLSSGKVYIYGTNVKQKEYAFFQLSRIIEILDVNIKPIDVSDIERFRVKYELKSLSPQYKLSDDEKIVEINNDSIIVEMESSSKFILKQKIMEYGSMCKVLEPEDFRQDIIDTLKRMREGYVNG